MAIEATKRDGMAAVAHPASEPITLAEAKKHVEIGENETAHDSHLARLITAARENVERAKDVQLVTTTYDWFISRLPRAKERLLFPVWPVLSVDSIYYIDTLGETKEWESENYIGSIDREPASLSPAYAKSWPVYRDQSNAVTIRFTSGFGDASKTPELIKGAMLLMIGSWFFDREGSDPPDAAMRLLDRYDPGHLYLEFAK